MILKAQILRSVRCQIEKQQLRRHYPKTSIEWSLEIPETCDLQLYCFSYFLRSQDLQLPVSFVYAVAKNVKPLVQNSLCENFYFISPSFIIRPASKDTIPILVGCFVFTILIMILLLEVCSWWIQNYPLFKITISVFKCDNLKMLLSCFKCCCHFTEYLFYFSKATVSLSTTYFTILWSFYYFLFRDV